MSNSSRTTTKTTLSETAKAIDYVKKLIPQLSESEKATLEIMLDQKSVAHLKRSLEESKRGEVISLEHLEKEL